MQNSTKMNQIDDAKKGHLPLLVSKERKRMHQKDDADYDESVWPTPLFSLKEAGNASIR